MVTPGGFEPTEYRRERPVTSAACRWCHTSLFLRPHLFLSGLSPHSHIPHIHYCVIRTRASETAATEC